MGTKASKGSKSFEPPSYSTISENSNGKSYLPSVYAKLSEVYIFEYANKDSDTYPSLSMRSFMDQFSSWAIGRKLKIEEMHAFCFIAAYKMKEEKLGINEINFDECILNLSK